jgi:Ice-binding-like
MNQAKLIPISGAIILTILIAGMILYLPSRATPATSAITTTTPTQTTVTRTPTGTITTSTQVTTITTTTPTSTGTSTQTTVTKSTSVTTTTATSTGTSTSTQTTVTKSTSVTTTSTATTTTTSTQTTSSSTTTSTSTTSTMSNSSSTTANAGPAPVNLGTAGNFVILAKTGISTTGTTSITGDIGVSPIDHTAITGFGLTLSSDGTYATSPLVTGEVYASDYAVPTPTMMTTAVSDMQTAYTDAAGRTNPTATELGAGDISGLTLTPGLYKWGTGVTINSPGLTLNCQGNANAVFIFQIGQTLTVGNGAIVTLSGSCQAKNVFWQVAGQTTLGTTVQFQGIVLDQTGIVLNTGATLNGRALAGTAVTLIANTVTSP